VVGKEEREEAAIVATAVAVAVADAGAVTGVEFA